MIQFMGDRKINLEEMFVEEKIDEEALEQVINQVLEANAEIVQQIRE